MKWLWGTVLLILRISQCRSTISHTVHVKNRLLKPGTTQKVRQLWTSTGFCPPKPHQAFAEYIKRDAFIQNIKLIGSLPYAPDRYQIRIHWLLDLIKATGSTLDSGYRFDELDRLVMLLHDNKLSIGFELMGNPSSIYTDFENPVQVYNWSYLVQQVVSRYIDYNKWKLWKFEGWNEPDHKDFDGLNVTVQGYLNYFDACERGVHKADPMALFGGPAASCRLTAFSKRCWALVDHVANGTNFFTRSKTTRLDFFSFHKKGGSHGQPGNSSYLLDLEIDTLTRLRSKMDYRFKNLTLLNDEGDPVKGWDAPMTFRADVRYPAMVVKLVHRHLYSSNTLFQDYQMTSNDNAFLSYHPHYFTQRTLFAHFQVNTSSQPFSVLVRKPIFDLSSMLAQVKGKLLVTNSNLDSESEYIGVIVSSGIKQLCYTFWISNDTYTYNADKILAKVHLPSEYRRAKYIVRTLNNETRNTYEQWLKMGTPANLTQEQIATLWNITMVQVTHPSYITTDSLNVHVAGPGVTQVILCLDQTEILIRPSNLKFHNVTRHAVLITWADEEVSECFLSYYLEFKRRGSKIFENLNKEAVLTRSYQFISEKGVIGQYRVRSANILGQSSDYSNRATYC